MEKILIVEDDIAFGTMIQTWLRKKGFEVEKTTSVKAAIQVCEEAERGFDLVLSDLRLPDHDGIFLLQWMRKHGVQVPFIVMTSYAEIQNVVLAMKSGATDYVAKPFHPEILLDKIKEAIKTPKKQDPYAASADSQRSTDTNSTPTNTAPGKQAGNQASSANGDVPKYLEGESEASRKLYSFVSLVAPTPMSVLILGASGTGKEYVARRIHELSTRANKPFFALDCGAIPKEVAASEFFGHVKGSFTGADQDKKGAFEIANGGTLFLDEMGNLNYEVQVQLLRALQERKIRPVGSNKEIDIDIRLVCATNENLAQRVAEGNFREDLYHRIGVIVVRVPALREHAEDIPTLVDHFIRTISAEYGTRPKAIDPDALAVLRQMPWTGNIRELRNVMERALLLAEGRSVRLVDLPPALSGAAAKEEGSERLLTLAELEEAHIRKVLGLGVSMDKAAALLGITTVTLWRKRKELGLE